MFGKYVKNKNPKGLQNKQIRVSNSGIKYQKYNNKKQHIINNILVRIELKLETMFFFSYLNG